MGRYLVIVVAGLVIGCGGDKNKGNSEPAPVAKTPAPKASPIDAAAATNRTAVPADGRAAAARLPALVRDCTKDSDCVAGYTMYERPSTGACCRGCNTEASNAESLAARRKACSALGSEGCPLKKCAALEPVACVDGACQVR
jgi:hypothetical protein